MTKQISQLQICPKCKYIGFPIALLSEDNIVCPRCAGGGNENNSNPDMDKILFTTMVKLNSKKGKELSQNISQIELKNAFQSALKKDKIDSEFGDGVQQFSVILLTGFLILGPMIAFIITGEFGPNMIFAEIIGMLLFISKRDILKKAYKKFHP